MNFETSNIGYEMLASDVSLVRVPGVAGRRKHHRLPKAKAVAAPKVKVAKVAKPKAEKVVKAPKVKAPAELSEKAAAMLSALRSVADAEGNVLVASIECAGVSGRSIGALLSVLSRKGLYKPAKKGHGIVAMPA